MLHKQVPLAGLAKRMDGLKVGVMSDFHAGASATRENIFHAISIMKAEKPEVIMLLGDFMDADFLRTRKNIGERAYVFDALQGLNAPLGIYAVLGNHDHYIDQGFVKKELSRIPAVVLDNQSVSLDNGLVVAGVDDLLIGRPNPQKALKNLCQNSTVMLLSHNPNVNLHLEGEARVGLVISGHTHGGQIRIPLLNWAPWVPGSGRYKGPSGLIRETKHRWTFITKGIGTRLAPVRVACPPDVAILYLTRAKPDV
ncbi:MAG: metallophosphoesterase [Deltaproteobacteria bacterium]|nr:MAG: metallophosphoesterase [Deltaproteobacteria bacterium]